MWYVWTLLVVWIMGAALTVWSAFCDFDEIDIETCVFTLFLALTGPVGAGVVFKYEIWPKIRKKVIWKKRVAESDLQP